MKTLLAGSKKNISIGLAIFIGYLKKSSRKITANSTSWERTVLNKFLTQLINAFVVLLIASIVFGLGMSLYMNDALWLWFCLPIFLFLS